jgi:hypothetical protein
MVIDDEMYVFMEDYSFSAQKGDIAYLKYPQGFENGEIEAACEEPFHMAYPYLFTYDGEIYATPEVAETDEIRLYRVKSPTNWEPVTVLINKGGIDPTVVKYNNRWWVFFTQEPYPNTKLYIWHSEELMGSWTPHEKNPVKTDVRSSRPGGTPFIKDNNLYRPAQDCAGGYGKRVLINRVEKLTPTEFRESTQYNIRAAEESAYPEGIHTLSSHGNITFVDGKRKLQDRYAIKNRLHQASQLISSVLRQ